MCVESVLDSTLVEQLSLLRVQIFDLLVLLKLLVSMLQRITLDTQVVRCGMPCGRDLIDGLFDMMVIFLPTPLHRRRQTSCRVSATLPASCPAFADDTKGTVIERLFSLQASALDWDPQAAMPRGGEGNEDRGSDAALHVIAPSLC